jgi:diguanylate cyclase (GGDEF)-like protein
MAVGEGIKTRGGCHFSMRDFFQGQGKAIILSIGLASAAMVGILDYLTGSHVTLTAIYLLPVYFVAWNAGAGMGVLLAVFCATAWLAAGHFAGRLFPSTLVMIWQFISLAAIAGVFATLLARLRKAQSRTQALSLVDFLTGALNSRAFYNLVENEHRKSERYTRPVTLVYIGLDHFKRVNSRYGHTVGDKVLQTVARTMMKYLRATDRVARLGGDEFVILLPETDLEAAKIAIPKICEQLADIMEDKRWPITFSVAVVTFVRVPPSARAMIKMAEKLMGAVKRDGKDAIRYASYKGGS